MLLSTVDHYNRLNAGVIAGKRVVGVLLGTSLKGLSVVMPYMLIRVHATMLS